MDKKLFRNTVLWLIAVCVMLPIYGCKDDEEEQYEFSEIFISPAQGEYHVGDAITLSITMLRDIEAKSSSFWFYYDYETKPMFVDINPETKEFVSPSIVLNKEGVVKLSFWGKYKQKDGAENGISKEIEITVKPKE